jgi:hypothetical protein
MRGLLYSSLTRLPAPSPSLRARERRGDVWREVAASVSTRGRVKTRPYTASKRGGERAASGNRAHSPSPGRTPLR